MHADVHVFVNINIRFNVIITLKIRIFFFLRFFASHSCSFRCTHSDSLWFSPAYSSSLRRSCIVSQGPYSACYIVAASVYPPLLLVFAIGQFLPAWALLTLKIIKTSWPPDVVNICCGPPWQRSNGEVMAVFRWPPLLPFMAITPADGESWGWGQEAVWSQIF